MAAFTLGLVLNGGIRRDLLGLPHGALRSGPGGAPVTATITGLGVPLRVIGQRRRPRRNAPSVAHTMNGWCEWQATELLR